MKVWFAYDLYHVKLPVINPIQQIKIPNPKICLYNFWIILNSNNFLIYPI